MGNAPEHDLGIVAMRHRAMVEAQGVLDRFEESAEQRVRGGKAR